MKWISYTGPYYISSLDNGFWKKNTQMYFTAKAGKGGVSEGAEVDRRGSWGENGIGGIWKII